MAVEKKKYLFEIAWETCNQVGGYLHGYPNESAVDGRKMGR